jgi:cysteine desulfurase family protein
MTAATAPQTIYLDHGATSWPKPPGVLDAMVACMEAAGANPGRGAYAMALAASRVVFEARRQCASILGVQDPRDLFFLSGATEGCNLMLKGLLRPGDRVVVSSMEHNAITRPLHVLSQAGVKVDYLMADKTGVLDLDRYERAVAEEPTRAVIVQHASNVAGIVNPIADLADIAHAAAALILVDGAQGGGHLAFDLTALDVDAYVVSGHKGMLGPQGIGILYLRPGLDVEPLLQGGTGGGSSQDAGQPKDRPERYEAGTPNTPGIAGLGAAARVLAESGDELRATEQALARKMRQGLEEIPRVRVLGPGPDVQTVPIISFVADGIEPDRVAFQLDRGYGIAVRSGLHCAPWAHRTLGTLETGAVRIGIGYGNTEQHVEAALGALREVLA